MFVRLVCFAVCLLSTPVALAETPPGEVSDKTLGSLKALAWQSLPTKIVQSDQKVVVIDKSDPSKIIIPDADAREIVRAASLTARARRCDLTDLVIANRDALLLREKKTGRWTESQLQYINTLHLFTVQLLAGKVNAAETETLQPGSGAQADMPAAAGCNEQEKQDISSAVEGTGRLTGRL
jgi:hypothetical protein